MENKSKTKEIDVLKTYLVFNDRMIQENILYRQPLDKYHLRKLCILHGQVVKACIRERKLSLLNIKPICISFAFSNNLNV